MFTHKECMNYLNGRCMLYGIPVDPNGQACPQFKPKNISTQYPNKFLSQYSPRNIQNLENTRPGLGRRRRWRHRRGKRFFFF